MKDTTVRYVSFSSMTQEILFLGLPAQYNVANIVCAVQYNEEQCHLRALSMPTSMNQTLKNKDGSTKKI